jgi:signal peptidase I
LVLALAVTFVVKAFVAQAFVIPSASMEPQLDVGDRVVVSRLAYRLHDPRRGDIVVFPNPEAHAPDRSVLPVRWLHDVLEAVGARKPSEQELIKRVVGLPGESVEGRGGHLYVDGQRLIEPYLPASVTTSDFGPVEVPAGRLFVMGDNRGDSKDSRAFGPIRSSTIVGRALFRVWPPGREAFV